jgi:polysaccharide biosynthesis/export protein
MNRRSRDAAAATAASVPTSDLIRAALFAGFLLCATLAGGSRARAQAAREAAPESAPATPASYRLRQGDKLSVRFLYHPELNEPSLVVRPDGLISLQMVDDVRAAGLTAAELKAALERAYREILLAPVITVSVLEFVAPRVYVSGQVARPGGYALRDGDTLLQAVALAGGFTPAAHRRLVLHARPVGERQLQVVAVDVTRLLTPEGRAHDLELRDGDYIFVPDSKLAKLSRVVEAFRFAVPGFTLR